MKKLIGAVALFAGFPLVAMAQRLQPLADLVSSISSLVGALVPILITMALVVFFWGLIRYLWPSGGKSNVAGAKTLMIWGIITLFVMVSIWGIVRLAQSALGVDPNATPTSPKALYPGSASTPSNIPGSPGYYTPGPDTTSPY
ncbi:MAG TPA: hypothetical protein VJJ20_02790 [Candidatus Paceibacterota bacterium]